MHDSLLKDIQLTVSSYIEEQLAEKDAQLLALKQQNQQLQAEVKKLRTQNDLLRQQQQSVAVKKEIVIQTAEQAEKAMALIASTNQPAELRFTTFLQLYRWNMKHLHYAIDVILALWTSFAQSVPKLPRVTPELTHLHTQFTTASAQSYDVLVTLLTYYNEHAQLYFTMMTDVFYKQANKAHQPFSTFALVAMYAYKQRNDACSDELYTALWQGKASAVRPHIEPLRQIIPLLPQTGVIAQLLDAPKKRARNVTPSHDWEAFITQATNGKFDRTTVVATFMKLVAENKKTNAYTKDFLRSIWKRIFTHYDVAYSAFEAAVKDVKLHEYFIEHDGQGVFMLIRLYNEHDAKEYMRSLLDAVMKQLVANAAYKALDVPILLAIYYSTLAKRYLANAKIQHYYMHDATERAQKMIRRFGAFEQSPSAQSFEAAYREVQMVDVYLDKIGVSRKQFGSRVFTAFYEATNRVQNTIDFSVPQHYDRDNIQPLSPDYSLVRFNYKTKKTTDDERWAALLDAIAEIGLARTVESLRYYIQLHVDDEAFAPMIAIWAYDLQRLQQAYVAGEL